MTLECTEARGEGATPSRYTTQKVCWELLTLNECRTVARICGLYIQGPKGLNCAFFTEPEEHIRKAGAQEVQQVFAKSDGESAFTVS